MFLKTCLLLAKPTSEFIGLSEGLANWLFCQIKIMVK